MGKGISYLVEALQKLSRMLSEKMCSEVLLVAIGNDFDKLKPLLPANIDSLGLGFVSKDELPEIYSMCDMYLCSSVNDAGPMMVNQSLCCGTPVVGLRYGLARSIWLNGAGMAIWWQWCRLCL